MKKICYLFVAMLMFSFSAEQMLAKNEKTVVVEFWEQDGADQQVSLDELITVFQQKNPTIRVKRIHMETEDLRRNFTSAAIGGAGPDVVLGPNDNMGIFVPGELIVPATDLMGKKFFADFDEVALSSSTYNGKIYMVPDRNGNELCLIYNKKLVKKAPETWEEMIKIGENLKSQEDTQYTLALCMTEPFFTIPFLSVFGGKVLDDPQSSSSQPTLNTPAVLEWCRFQKKMQDDGIIPKEADYDVASNLFKEGKVPFLINGPWSFVDYSENAEMDIALTPIPKINGKWPLPYSAVKGYSVSAIVMKDPAKQEAVKKFISYITGKEAQLKMSLSHRQLPTHKAALQDKQITTDPIIMQQKLQLEHSTPMPIVTQMRAVWDAMRPVQRNLLAGITRVEDAPAQMQKRAVDGIRALGLTVKSTTDYPDVRLDEYSEPAYSESANADEEYDENSRELSTVEMDEFEGIDLNQPLGWLRSAENNGNGEQLFSSIQLFSLFVERYYNDSDNPSLAIKCPVSEIFSKDDLEKRKEIYEKLAVNGPEEIFFLSLPFNNGPIYDFSRGGYEVRYISCIYKDGGVKSAPIGRKAGKVQSLEFSEPLFIKVERSTAERLRSDSYAEIRIMFQCTGLEDRSGVKRIMATPLFVRVYGNELYYEQSFRNQ